MDVLDPQTRIGDRILRTDDGQVIDVSDMARATTATWDSQDGIMTYMASVSETGLDEGTSPDGILLRMSREVTLG